MGELEKKERMQAERSSGGYRSITNYIHSALRSLSIQEIRRHSLYVYIILIFTHLFECAERDVQQVLLPQPRVRRACTYSTPQAGTQRLDRSMFSILAFIRTSRPEALSSSHAHEGLHSNRATAGRLVRHLEEHRRGVGEVGLERL